MAKADQYRFALRAEVEDDFAGGSLAFGDGQTIDLAERLSEKRGGKGVIVTDDPLEADALREHPALKAVGPTEAEEIRDESEDEAEAEDEGAADTRKGARK